MDLVQYILFDTMPWESKQQGMYRSQKAEREIYGLQATGFGIVGTSEESVTDMATEPRPGSAIRDLFSSRPCPCSRESQFHALASIRCSTPGALSPPTSHVSPPFLYL